MVYFSNHVLIAAWYIQTHRGGSSGAHSSGLPRGPGSGPLIILLGVALYHIMTDTSLLCHELVRSWVPDVQVNSFDVVTTRLFLSRDVRALFIHLPVKVPVEKCETSDRDDQLLRPRWCFCSWAKGKTGLCAEAGNLNVQLPFFSTVGGRLHPSWILSQLLQILPLCLPAMVYNATVVQEPVHSDWQPAKSPGF